MKKILTTAILSLLLLAACGKKGGTADVDCDKLMNHMIELTVKYTAAKQPDKLDQVKQALDGAKAKAIAQCNEQKASKKLTVEQYACMMKADEFEAFTKCVQPAEPAQ